MRGAIFDVDGTLVDSVDLHARAWAEAFAHFGHDVPFDKVRMQIGKGGDQLLPVFLSKQELKEQGSAIEQWRGVHFKKHYLARVTAFSKVRELFSRLIQDGWKLALASSAKEDELKVYKQIARIDDLLDTETSSDDAEKSKPHPDIFQAALKRLGAAPSECVVIGDSPYDAEAATKAGITAVGFLSGGFPKKSLTAAGFRALYKGPAALLAAYEKSLFNQKR